MKLIILFMTAFILEHKAGAHISMKQTFELLGIGTPDSIDYLHV